MKKEILVSVIIPTYNRKFIIERAIKSVLNQTYKNWELIIIDDGSTDNTKEALKQYLKNKRIRYYYKKNGGVSSARNMGIKKVKGMYIAFLDSDDEFLPNKIRFQLNVMKKHKTGLSLSNAYIQKTNKKEVEKKNIPNIFITKSNFLKFPMSASYIMVEKNKIYYDEELYSGEDLDYFLRNIKDDKAIFISLPIVIRHKEDSTNRISVNSNIKRKATSKLISKVRSNTYGFSNNHFLFRLYLGKIKWIVLDKIILVPFFKQIINKLIGIK